MASSAKTVRVVTMGCSKNRVDSEHLLMQLSAAGYRVSPEEEELESAGVDIVIINTCGFILDAKEESIEMILDAIDAKKRGIISKVYVFGCLSQRYRHELPLELPEVDGFYGAFDITPLLKDLGVRRDPSLETGRFLTTPSHYSYLKVSEGCNRHCSYCAIPGIRGGHVSVPVEALVEEAQSMVESGVKELNVIAQDTTYYGLDIYGKRTLAPLLARLEEIRGLEWIRILYSYPAAFPEDVIEVMASSRKICRYMDIPLQHSEDAVLAAMRRNVDGAQTRALVEKFRSMVPDIVLRTTMMVGHPGEGDKEFDRLIDFIREYRFERLGAFAYSEEEGTWGAANLQDSIPADVKQERLETLMEVQADISLASNVARIGTYERVLFDSYDVERGVLVGRTSTQAPEVDGEVLVDAAGVEDPQALIGTFADVKVVDADEYDLTAEIMA